MGSQLYYFGKCKERTFGLFLEKKDNIKTFSIFSKKSEVIYR
eukprot:UN15172